MYGDKYLVNNVGYLLVHQPEHPRADKSGAYKGYVYEHIVVAETKIGRFLRKAEQVHHLDFNRVNNCPENLLVLLGSSHRQLHAWLDSVGYEPPESERFRYADSRRIKTVMAECIRCRRCKFPLSNRSSKFCSLECRRKRGAKFVKGTVTKRPSKKKLVRLLAKYNWVKVGKRYGVSDNAVRKWARSYGLDPKKL